MMKKLLTGERGNVMVTSILLLSIMLSLGLAAASRVDTQTSQSRTERERESSFNLAEASLSAQTFILGRRGSRHGRAGVPARMPQRASTDFCPNEEQLMRSYTAEGSQQVDFGEGTMWVTEVRDDANAAGQPVRFWDDSYLEVTNWPRYDKDNNRHVWVRAEATVRGDPRDRGVGADRGPHRAVPAVRGPRGVPARKEPGGHGGRPLVDSTGSLGVAACCAPRRSRAASTSTPRRGRSSSRPRSSS